MESQSRHLHKPASHTWASLLLLFQLLWLLWRFCCACSFASSLLVYCCCCLLSQAKQTNTWLHARTLASTQNPYLPHPHQHPHRPFLGCVLMCTKSKFTFSAAYLRGFLSSPFVLYIVSLIRTTKSLQSIYVICIPCQFIYEQTKEPFTF